MSSLDPSVKSAETPKPNTEREQKFLITAIPDIILSQFPHSEITQGYVNQDAMITLLGTPGNYREMIFNSNVDEKKSFTKIPITDEQYNKLRQVSISGFYYGEAFHPDAIVRVRSKGDKMFQTVKMPAYKGEEGVKSRIEIELEIDQSQYDLLTQCVDGNVISKTRYTLADSDSFEVICDVFKGPFEGLVLVEVEAKGDADFSHIFLPPWIKNSRNVSDFSDFSNVQLSKMSKEEIAIFLREKIGTRAENS